MRERPPPPEVPNERLSRFLLLGLRGEERPLDRLIERLSRADGESWFRNALESIPDVKGRSPVEQLAEGWASVQELCAIKDRCKHLRARSSGEEDILVSMLGYFLAVAAALVHHATVISGRSGKDLEPLLLDLATTVPEPWSDLLARAAVEAAGEEG